jgi:hypothetical protein
MANALDPALVGKKIFKLVINKIEGKKYWSLGKKWSPKYSNTNLALVKLGTKQQNIHLILFSALKFGRICSLMFV